MIINRRPIRASLGSRVVRRSGTKKGTKVPPKVLVEQKVREILAKKEK